jgi:hypothetical protein
MLAGLVFAAFLAADAAAVVCALTWLSNYRSRQDITDLRFRRRSAR